MKSDNIQPELDEKGLAAHGVQWGQPNQYVLRAVSKGPGVPVEVRPVGNGGPPVRVVSGEGSARMTGGKLFVTPTAAAAGTETTIVIEM